MTVTLAEAKASARAFLAAGQPAAALATFDHILTAAPLDDDVRLSIADLLTAAGKPEDAQQIYRALTGHLLRAGRPLPALVVAERLADVDPAASAALRDALTDMYAAGSPRLAPFAARAAPLDPNLPIPALDTDSIDAARTDAGEGGAASFDDLAASATRRALDLTASAELAPPQEQVHPIAFLSELEPDSLRAVLASLQVKRVAQGQQVFRQGEPGTSLFLVALGQLQVATTLNTGAQRELARLHENSLFGEMALVTSQARGASVTAVEDATVLELDRAALDRVRASLPSIEVALARFTRERLIKNLLATSPLFTPFTREQQKQLLQRFEGTEVDAGVTVIRQGEAGQGLYIVLTGEMTVEALADPSVPVAEPIALGKLQPGDIFGEMSLLTDQPTSATVRATVPCTLLFLPRLYFDRLTDAIPEVKQYFATIAQRRANDNSSRLFAGALPEETVELDDSDGILI
jgi:CRP-like cAMP-binding protein